MKKQVIVKEHNIYNPHRAKDYVYDHRNIFSKYTRRYIFSFNPIIIKEIDTSPDDKKQYWYWVFLNNKIIIYQFDKKPNRKEIDNMLKDIEEEKTQ